MVETLNGFNHVSTEVDFGEGNQAVQALDFVDQVVCEVQDSEFAQVTDVLDLGNFIGM